jgi:putative peptidoglycan lipid II flippase
MLAFILIPVAVTLMAVSHPLARVTLQYGVMTGAGVALVARVLTSFALGLPAYSAFLVFTRAFYARGDTKTPALVNGATVVVASLVGAGFFFAAADELKVAGLALGHSIAFTGGTMVLARAFRRRAGALGGTKLNAAVLRALLGAAGAGIAMLVTTTLVHLDGRPGAAIEVVVAGLIGGTAYLALQRAMGAPELQRLVALVRPAK